MVWIFVFIGWFSTKCTILCSLKSNITAISELNLKKGHDKINKISLPKNCILGYINQNSTWSLSGSWQSWHWICRLEFQDGCHSFAYFMIGPYQKINNLWMALSFKFIYGHNHSTGLRSTQSSMGKCYLILFLWNNWTIWNENWLKIWSMMLCVSNCIVVEWWHLTVTISS